MDWTEFYTVTSSERLQELEAQLADELEELHEEIQSYSKIGVTPAKYISSIPIPKNVEHFRKERLALMKRALNVSHVKPVEIQASKMWQEQNISDKREYTAQSIPLILHQYFMERVHQLIVLKYRHLLRWKRFCKHSKIIENLYPYFNGRLTEIMKEYDDCVSRCQRLSVAVESNMSQNDAAVMVVQPNDLFIYIRHLVFNLHSIKKFNCFLKTLEHMPTSHYWHFSTKLDGQVRPNNQEVSGYMGENEDKDHLSVKRSNTPSSQVTESSHQTPNDPKQHSHPECHPSHISSHSSGLCSYQTTESVPLLCNDLDAIKPLLTYFLEIYGIQYNVEAISSTAEEMELYAVVCKKFKTVFAKQEFANTFKIYDSPEATESLWGSETSLKALKKEANWLPFITLKPEKCPHKDVLSTFKQKNHCDELLRLHSFFLKLKDSESVLASLKQHASLVRGPLSLPTNAASVQKFEQMVSAMWSKIYSYPNLSNGDGRDENGDEPTKETAQFTRKKQKSFDYTDTLQMLGLEDSEHDRNDPESIQGAYLSFLILRYINIRDLQRSILGILNYFRSLERTLTINDNGLTVEGNRVFVTSMQNHRVATESGGTVGGSGGLTSHSYVHNTPIDFKFEETEFMKFTEIENHDDFYTLEDDHIHVQDLRGYYIMYDAALDDLQQLENELLLVSSSCIEQSQLARKKQHSSNNDPNKNTESTPLNVIQYGCPDVDRFTILFDLWNNELAFQKEKKFLVDCYMEAYLHLCDRDERRNMAQVLINLFYQRPRYDFTSPYFVKNYRIECINMKLQATLTKCILDSQIEDDREYYQSISNTDSEHIQGLPFSIIRRQPIAINMSLNSVLMDPRPALKSVYLMEFHQSLAIASRLPSAIQHVYHDLASIYEPATVYESLLLERKLLELCLDAWKNSRPVGSLFPAQLQKELFSDMLIENPVFIADMTKSFIDQEEMLRHSKKEQQFIIVDKSCSVMELVTLRYRLILAAFETEILSQIYYRDMDECGFEKFHIYSRCVQYDTTVPNKNLLWNPPNFISDLSEEDYLHIDKFMPSHVSLAIQEVDDCGMSRVNFREPDGILQLLQPHKLETLQLTLKAQIIQKNALYSIIQLLALYRTGSLQVKKTSYNAPSDANNKSGNTTSVPTAAHHRQSVELLKFSQAFVSLQIEKIRYRNLLLNDYIQRKEKTGGPMKTASEIEKLKRAVIEDYLQRFNDHMTRYSLRGQMINYCNSIQKLLAYFPKIRETYFMIGEENEVKSNLDDYEGLIVDHSKIRKRPRRILSQNGNHVLNIWFIPNQSEILTMFSDQKDERCNKSLRYCTIILGSLHDILQYLCALAHMGTYSLKSDSDKKHTSAGWGGCEGIVTELQETQSQINNLIHPTSCQEVCDFLVTKREAMFLEFEAAVRFSMRDTFLSAGNADAYRTVADNIHFSLPNISNIQIPQLGNVYLPVPEPYEAYDDEAVTLFPWRSFIGNCGSFPIKFWPSNRISYFINLCLAGVSESDKLVANGEILGVSLLMDDVLDYQYKVSFLSQLNVVSSPAVGAQVENVSETNGSYLSPDNYLSVKPPGCSASNMMTSSSQSKQSCSNRRPSTATHARVSADPLKKRLSRYSHPIESFRMLKTFLLLWKQVEIVKEDWGRRKFNVQTFDSVEIFKEYSKAYRSEILVPVLQSIAKRSGHYDAYDGAIQDNDAVPTETSEFEIRLRLLVTLLEFLESSLIQEVRKKIARELNFVIAEKSRKEEALPTDVWKKPITREGFTLPRSNIVENFWMKLTGDLAINEGDENVVISVAHMNDCVHELNQMILSREKQNYESYTVFYETLLRSHHALFYKKEQEVKHLQDKITQMLNNNDVELQCGMGDNLHDFIIELTAMRSKLNEVKEENSLQMEQVREVIRSEYHDLTIKLFNMTFQLKAKFDEFRQDLYEDVIEKINETRKDAVESLKKSMEKIDPNGSLSCLDASNDFVKYCDRIRTLENENYTLNKTLLKLKMMSLWKQNQSSLKYTKMINKLNDAAIMNKKQFVDIKMHSDEEIRQLKQHLAAIRKSLAEVELECNQVKKEFEKDLKNRQKLMHIDNEKTKTSLLIEQKQKDNIDNLTSILNEKDKYLKFLADEQERKSHLKHIHSNKGKRDINYIKRQLQHEKQLKYDAFLRLEQLQNRVHHVEDIDRQSTTSDSPEKHKWMLRAQSAVPSQILTRVLACSERLSDSAHRPKTVPARLKSTVKPLIR